MRMARVPVLLVALVYVTVSDMALKLASSTKEIELQ